MAAIKVSVIGAGECSAETAELAYRVGKLIAMRNAVLVCGGLGGVMEHACRGAKDAGGLTVGILPGFSAHDANPYVDIPLPTGLSHARNILVVRAGDGIVAVEGSYGTLSEIAIALKLGKPVVGLKTWDISPDIHRAESPEEAIDKLFQIIKQGC